jgi:hypothetical protein
MMDHIYKESKITPADDSDASQSETPASYYYDDSTNYETYCDEDEDEESLPQDNDQDQA